MSPTRDLTDGATPAGPAWGVAAAQALLLAIPLGVVFYPSFDFMVFKWSTDGDWSHGWLVPIFSLYFLAAHRAQLLATPARPSYWGLLLVIGSLTTFSLARMMNYGYPQYVAFVPCLLGLVLLLCGWGILRVAWFPIAFLLCAVPLPQSLYFRLTFPLRRLASLAAGLLLGLLPGVDTEIQGVVIDWVRGNRSASINVEEACSGMRLMMAFCTLGLAMAYLGDRPLWQRVIVVLACIPIAVFCNTIRVCVTGVLLVYGHDDWTQGTAHELLGLAMLPIALGLFALVGYVLRHLFVEVTEEEENALPAAE